MELNLSSIGEALILNGSKILFVIVVAWLIKRFGMMFVRRIIRSSVKRNNYATAHDQKQREDTLISVMHAVLNVLLWVIVVMLILDLLGVNVAPLIAGAGIAGVALGFGAQSLVKDVIAGMFVLLENQFRVGDLVRLDVGSSIVTGTVEKIDLRISVLRDLDGGLHHVPNGTIVVATNLSKEFSGVNIEIGVAYESDLTHVISVVDAVGKELKKDKDWSDRIIETPSFLRIEKFADSSINIKITGKTLPLEQWAVSGELLKRIKIAFDKEKITIPFPQRVVHTKK